MNKFFRYFRNTTILFTILSVLILITCIADTSSAADRDMEYVAKQITNFKVDGNIREWDRAEVVPFDQLKDAGNQLPDPDDFTGSGRVAWNANDPTRIYFLVEITDDTLQDIHPANSMWWVDDSVEFMFDFDNNVTRDALVQWTLGANGKDLSAAGSSSNTEWIVVKNGNDYIYEVALDPTKQRGANPGNDSKGKDFRAKDGLTVGFSFHMNDCENGGREHQIGWIAGQAWDPLSFGDLTFDKEFLDVEPSGKIALTWAAIKR